MVAVALKENEVINKTREQMIIAVRIKIFVFMLKIF